MWWRDWLRYACCCCCKSAGFDGGLLDQEVRLWEEAERLLAELRISPLDGSSALAMRERLLTLVSEIQELRAEQEQAASLPSRLFL
jgi:hypothetical protein